jgi:hypothetical protein
MKIAELRGSRSYDSFIDPKERGARPLSKLCVGPGLILVLAVGSGVNSNFNDSSNTELRIHEIRHILHDYRGNFADVKRS